MTTIGVLARKGGAGKSTLTLHWAVEAERQGQGQVAVIDMDSQQTSVKWSKRRLQQLGKHTPAMLVASAGDLQQALAACEASGMTISVHLRPFELSGVLIGYHETQE
jgi:chromosome partitioning protein